MELDADIRAYLQQMEDLALPPIWEQPLEAVRQAGRELSATAESAPVASVRDDFAGSVPVRIYRPVGAEGPIGLTVLYHGGGFVFGDLESYDPFARRLCAGSGTIVVSAGYRLAPENPFPAAADDAGEVMQWCLEHADGLGADPARIFVMGDSAGGNLAAVVANAFGDSIAGQVLAYPVTDMTERRHESRILRGEGFGLTSEAMIWYGKQYLPETADRSDPRASPLYADPTSAAPALVITCEFDPLADEAIAYVQLLEESGVEVERLHLENAHHGVLNVALDFAAGRVAWARINGWIRERAAGD